MKLQIHKAAGEDVLIELSEGFPSHYGTMDRVEVCETEARALFDALKAGLPDETKAAFVRLIQRSADFAPQE